MICNRLDIGFFQYGWEALETALAHTGVHRLSSWKRYVAGPRSFLVFAPLLYNTRCGSENCFHLSRSPRSRALAFAQGGMGFNPSGMWTAMYHEDELERTDPGSPAGDYLGIPINDDARLRADTWDGDLVSVLQHQCIPHSAVYAMRAPSALKIRQSTILRPVKSSRTSSMAHTPVREPSGWMAARIHPNSLLIPGQVFRPGFGKATRCDRDHAHQSRAICAAMASRSPTKPSSPNFWTSTTNI